MNLDDTDLDPRTMRKVESAFWRKSAPYLRGDGPRPNLRLLWREALMEVLAEDEAGIAAKAGPVRCAIVDTLDAPPATVAFEVKDDADPGTVVGYLAVFNNEDLVRDVIHQGAFTKTLTSAYAERRRRGGPALYPCLWQHMKDEPIGYFAEAKEDRHGLLVTAVLDTSIERGRQALFGLKSGAMSFSIGYKPLRYEWKGATRHLNEIALGEGSAVTFPANPEAHALFTPSTPAA